MADSAPAAPPTLVRAIGRWDLTATVVNAVIGSAIFGLPATVASHTGAWSPLAVLLAGLGILPIVLCFAEVGSRFDGAGGPYLYARSAFGAQAGFHVGWLLVWTRLLTGAAVLNVLANYAAQLVPWVGTPVGRAATMVLVVLVVTATNVRGVRQAAWTVNFFTLAKLLPLLLVIGIGAVAFRGDVLRAQAAPAPDWTQAVLLLVFAYGGFESAVVAASETRRPREDTAFALGAGIVVITIVYVLVQLAVVATLPNAAASEAPIADALRAAVGPAGAAIGGGAAVVSTFGWLLGFGLLTPRVLYSMGERGEVPAVFGRVHPQFRTPHVAIITSTVIALAIGLWGTFAATATLSAISRLVVYAVTCAALVRLRRRGEPPAGFVLPGGPLFAAAGIAFTIWLLSTRSLTQAWLLGAIVIAGVLVWFAGRRRPTTG